MNMYLNLTGDTSSIIDGFNILAKSLDVEKSDTGYPIQVIQRKGPIYISNKNGQGEIHFDKEIHFFRGIGLWLENFEYKNEFELTEHPQFETSGAMLDASRNAVLTKEGIQSFLRQMAVMGLNLLMVYTEDTYEVDEYPYFGYMRGRYTQAEMKECDDYARTLGIEMVPCIQTLAHLTEALKWNYAAEIKDTADILLAEEPKTYEFLENIIAAASNPFESNRIHIGMDEAHQLGLGNYLAKNGYRERFDIMNDHLQKVVSITEDLNLEPMIWSDMYFRLGSTYGGYYDVDATIPENVVASIPDVQLVYWDYYHSDESFYKTFMQKHKDLKSDPIFAGGVWTWNGIAPNYGKGLATSEAALTASKKEGIKEVFATMWGDNGAETPLTTSLPVLQLFAEHTYNESVDCDQLKRRFRFCAGAEFDDFMCLNQFDETPGVSRGNLHESNPSKFLLWQDILLGLYDENVKGLSLGKHYEKMIPKLKEAKKNNPRWDLLFDFYAQLAVVLSVKADIGIRLKEIYEADDKNGMELLVDEIRKLKKDVTELRNRHRTLWFSMNKPFGWEVIEIRYGGVISRMDTVEYRMKAWLEGQVSKLEELEEERLYYEGPFEMPEGSLGRNLYHGIVSASPL